LNEIAPPRQLNRWAAPQFDVTNPMPKSLLTNRLPYAVLSMMLIHPLVCALTQSGKVRTPPSAPATQTALPNEQNAKSDTVAIDDDEYKLIFATNYDGKLSYSLDRGNKRLRVAIRSELDSFLQQLNRVAEQGYRLKSAIYRGVMVALVKFDERPYEYAAFDTTSNYFFSVGAFEDKYAALSRERFHVIHHSHLQSYCEDLDQDHVSLGQYCEFFHRFLLERKYGPDKPAGYALVGSKPFRTNSSVELSRLIDQKLGDGFIPTIAISGYQILVEQPEGDDRLPDKLQSAVVRLSAFKDLRKEVNELGTHGYRLALTDDGIALMIRYGETVTPVKYVWLKADNSLDRQLGVLQQKGAVYRMIFADYEGGPTILVFEENPNDQKRREYRVLKFPLQFTENAAEKKVYITLTPSSRDAMRVLNQLVKEGFVVRDLFVSDQVSVLLERSS
jgi:hypothetical protein